MPASRAWAEVVHARAGSISDAPPGPEAPPPPPPRGAGKALKSLGTKQVSNIFVQLRKIAQHPLLVRSLYSDSTVDTVAAICRKRFAAHRHALHIPRLALPLCSRLTNQLQ